MITVALFVAACCGLLRLHRRRSGGRVLAVVLLGYVALAVMLARRFR